MVGATLTICSPGYRGCFLVEPGSVGSAIFPGSPRSGEAWFSRANVSEVLAYGCHCWLYNSGRLTNGRHWIHRSARPAAATVTSLAV